MFTRRHKRIMPADFIPLRRPITSQTPSRPSNLKEVNYITGRPYLCQDDTKTHIVILELTPIYFRALDSTLVPRMLDRGLIVSFISISGSPRSRSSDSYHFFSEETWVVEAEIKGPSGKLISVLPVFFRV
jgi:hypothetical protein